MRKLLFKYLFLCCAVLFILSCNGHSHEGSHSHERDSLEVCISDFRYKSAAMLDTLGVAQLGVAGGDNETEMVARNAMAYSALMKMDYLYCEELYGLVAESSSCEIERLVADVGLMTLSYRVSANREFFDYRARALHRIARINEDIDYLSDADRERFYRAKIEFGIVSICYYSNLAMHDEMETALDFLEVNIGKTDNSHQKIYAQMILANNEDGTIKRLNSLFSGLLDARAEKIKWVEANYELLLAISLRDSLVMDKWYSAEPEIVGMLAPKGVELGDIPLYLADKAIENFDEYGDYYMKIEAMAVKSSCYTQRGEYANALELLESRAMYEINDYYASFYPDYFSQYPRSLDDKRADSIMALGDVSDMYNIPECILSVRREASCAYAGLGETELSELNRQAYLELLKGARSNKLYESRVSMAEANVTKLRLFSLSTLFALVVVSILVFLYNKRKRRYKKEYSVELKRMPVIARKLISALPQDLVDKKTLCRHISSLLNENLDNEALKTRFSIAEPIEEEELPNNYEFTLRYIDAAGEDLLYVATSQPLNSERLALIAMVVPHIAAAVEEGLRLANISDEQERVEEQHQAYALYLAEHKRENLLKRVSVSVVMSMRPFMDRAMNELRALSATDDAADAERKLKYVAELTGRLDDLNVILERWIKMRKGELNLKVENFSLEELFAIIEKSSMRLNNRGISLIISGGEVAVRADKALTLFMINTLVDNASKFTLPGGRISLETVEGDNFVEIAVEDSGIGISQEDIDRILGEKVYDASSIGCDNEMLQKKSKGGGFGLMNCKGIIEKYRKTDEMFSVCSMDIKSTKGKGSRFSFRLPKGVVRFIILLLSLFPASLFAEDSTFVKLRECADSVYNANICGNYYEAIEESQKALDILNSYYVSRTGGCDTLVLSRGSYEELQWWRKGLFTADRSILEDVYYNIMDLRNELAVAALALQDWDLYRYNNYIFTILYTNVHESKGLVEHYESVRNEVALYEAIIAIACVLVFVLVAYSLASYVRHNIIERNNERLMTELNRRLLDLTASVQRLPAADVLQRIADEIYASLGESMRIEKLMMSLRVGIAAGKLDATSPKRAAVDIDDILISGVIDNGRGFVSRDGMLRVLPLIVNVDGEPLTMGAFKVVTARPLSNNEVVALELVAGYAASVAHHSIGRVAMSYIALEEIEEETERMKFEENRLHVQNMVMDNCLSVIKHETIYYPSRIRELANRAMADISDRAKSIAEMHELMDYYNSIFGILSNCAKRELDDSGFAVSKVHLKELFASMQRYVMRRSAKKGIALQLDYEPVELVVSVDADLVEFLFESLLEAAMKCTKDGRLLLRASDAGDVVKVELVDGRRTIESLQVAEMFTPSNYNINNEGGVDGMEYLVAKEIIRLHEDIIGKRGGRIEARSDVSGTVIMFTLLK